MKIIIKKSKKRSTYQNDSIYIQMYWQIYKCNIQNPLIIHHTNTKAQKKISKFEFSFHRNKLKQICCCHVVDENMKFIK